MPSLSRSFEVLAGAFLTAEAAASIHANPSDPPATQFGRIARVLIGLAMLANALGS